jgi:hypothetical protein
MNEDKEKEDKTQFHWFAKPTYCNVWYGIVLAIARPVFQFIFIMSRTSNNYCEIIVCSHSHTDDTHASARPRSQTPSKNKDLGRAKEERSWMFIGEVRKQQQATTSFIIKFILFYYFSLLWARENDKRSVLKSHLKQKLRRSAYFIFNLFRIIIRRYGETLFVEWTYFSPTYNWHCPFMLVNFTLIFLLCVFFPSRSSESWTM